MSAPVVLRAAGARVASSLGDASATVAPGTIVRARVTALRVGSPRISVVLRRTDGSRGVRVLKRRSLRAGAFAARLPAAFGARYTLTARAVGRTWRAVIRTTPKPARRPAEPKASVSDPSSPTPIPPSPPPGTPIDVPGKGAYGEEVARSVEFDIANPVE
ncbi:hypothetical protein [Conexibacter sp. CPCC 206217]|uniref:hypothetical protein n=1 Tax=Conexibacter sp. CPCC 206217 TaxID=3064574 RepID=UPI00271D28D3|nr:hypothetical protein [Conexibacter sp. CPCC 206217]MDO8211924.1 hypothetical protein [Conexibacter sp. CPCC 206217]